MKPFLLKTSVGTAEAISYVDQLINIIGWTRLSKRVDRILQDAKSNPFATDYLMSKYFQELSLHRCKKLIRSWRKIGVESYDTVAFASAYMQIFNRLSQRGQANIKGKLISGIETDDNGLGPLRFELLTAAHFSQMGIKLLCNDYEAGGGFDFYGELSGYNMEIECKYIGTDKGRKIPMKHLLDFSRSLKEKNLPPLNLFIDVIITGRFPTNTDKKTALFEAIYNHIFCKEYYHTQIHAINIYNMNSDIIEKFMRKSKEEIIDLIRKIARSEYGLENTPILMLMKRRYWMFVSFRSTSPDTHISAIYRDLKDAAKRQLSGKRAGILCIHLSGINANEMNALQKRQNGLETMSLRLMRTYPNIMQIAYCAKQEVKQKIIKLPATHHTFFSGSGRVYAIGNINHPLNRQLELFSN